MPLKLSLDSSSTGEVFVSTNDAIEKGIIPQTKLPPDHCFHKLWRDHLAALGRPGLYDTVIDALVALTKRNPSWRRRTNIDGIVAGRREIREILRQHPPDVVVVSGVDSYGYHHRDARLWPYIQISERYVKLWEAADKSSEQGLALTVVIAAAIDHEIGHWIFTLKSGFFSPEVSDIQENESQVATSQLINNTSTKKLGVEWRADSGEAGDFVETRSRGGILGYSEQFLAAFIVTGARKEDIHFLPPSYLRNYIENSPLSPERPSLRFVPPDSRLDPGLASVERKDRLDNSFFPKTVDDCFQPSSASSSTSSGSGVTHHLSQPLRNHHCEMRMRAGILLRELMKQRLSKPEGSV